MATNIFAANDVVEPVDTCVNPTAISSNINEKSEPALKSPSSYHDVEVGEDGKIHHPATKDDILTRTIHLDDDPTLVALTFRTWFLGMSPNVGRNE